MRILFKHINELVQVRKEAVVFVAGHQMKELPTLKNAYLLIEDGKIADFGSMEACPTIAADEVIDATGKMILPSWCDAHTHIVYAGNREAEFVDRINGLSYEAIANKGGGILNSAKQLNETSEEEIYLQSKIRLEEIIALGTGAVEIKSGYGLTIEGELKMLRVIQKFKANYPIEIKATFLGAHAIPAAFKGNKDGYLQMLIDELLPKIAAEKLASFIELPKNINKI